ncbi:3,4-dihydroxy-2-butanone-4-phosphate synthase [Rhodococcus pseudokoreensis]|uniref:3,4-dihydroxy-2-butanone-4-phosphate synthase n=1 Tax=Rhodococcus pseudokoreensis TaxID=2811421 RepID=A0A974W119_9NOCA|nr:3,4-dihydroxy-2-butanone-4-phosphate synthase [Rhodococcus pseudokoreensis]
MSRVQQSLSDLAAGRPVVLAPGPPGDRDGYLLLAAEKASPASVAFLVKHSSGFICAGVTRRECTRLDLPPMTGTDRRQSGGWHTVAVDAIEGVSTGISASDRAHTLRQLASREYGPPIHPTRPYRSALRSRRWCTCQSGPSRGDHRPQSGGGTSAGGRIRGVGLSRGPHPECARTRVPSVRRDPRTELGDRRRSHSLSSSR